MVILNFERTELIFIRYVLFLRLYFQTYRGKLSMRTNKISIRLKKFFLKKSRKPKHLDNCFSFKILFIIHERQKVRVRNENKKHDY